MTHLCVPVDSLVCTSNVTKPSEFVLLVCGHTTNAGFENFIGFKCDFCILGRLQAPVQICRALLRIRMAHLAAEMYLKCALHMTRFTRRSCKMNSIVLHKGLSCRYTGLFWVCAWLFCCAYTWLYLINKMYLEAMEMKHSPWLDCTRYSICWPFGCHCIRCCVCQD